MRASHSSQTSPGRSGPGNLPAAERRFLTEIQKGFPVCSAPWDALGERLQEPGSTLIARAQDLRERGILRSVSGLFNRDSLGYSGTLAAFSCTSERLPIAAEVVNQHPGVSHNYERFGTFNLWFTLAVPDRTLLGRTLEVLAREARAEAWLNLPVVRAFKLRVFLDLESTSPPSAVRDDPAHNSAQRGWLPLSDFRIHCVRALQRDFPLVHNPYEELGKPLGTPGESLVREAERFLAEGYLRRVGGVLHHRRAGFGANALVVWNVRTESTERIASRFAEVPEVSHCYERYSVPGWPYRLYTMVHGRTQAECEALVKGMSASAGEPEHEILYSGREFKKERIEYFSPRFREWEKRHL